LFKAMATARFCGSPALKLMAVRDDLFRRVPSVRSRGKGRGRWSRRPERPKATIWFRAWSDFLCEC